MCDCETTWRRLSSVRMAVTAMTIATMTGTLLSKRSSWCALEKVLALQTRHTPTVKAWPGMRGSKFISYAVTLWLVPRPYCSDMLQNGKGVRHLCKCIKAQQSKCHLRATINQT